MPSFPASVWSPTVKSAGAVIDAAHINDPQDEIVAIEGGYLNGTARLNSSQSTLATLSVTGGSTFTGNVQMTGVLLGIPAIRITHSAVQEIPSGAWTGLSWNTEIVDASGMHSTSANSSRITFAPSTGIYQVGVTVGWSTHNGNGTFLGVRVNDSSHCVTAGQVQSSLLGLSQTVNAILRVASTADYITAVVNSQSATGSIQVESTAVALGFWAYRITG